MKDFRLHPVTPSRRIPKRVRFSEPTVKANPSCSL